MCSIYLELGVLNMTSLFGTALSVLGENELFGERHVGHLRQHSRRHYGRLLSSQLAPQSTLVGTVFDNGSIYAYVVDCVTPFYFLRWLLVGPALVFFIFDTFLLYATESLYWYVNEEII